MKLDKDTLRDLIDEKLPRGQVRAIQSGFKDADRFDKYVEILQERASWDDQIVLPFGEHLYIVKSGDGYRVKCDCGNEFCLAPDYPSLGVERRQIGQRQNASIGSGDIARPVMTLIDHGTRCSLDAFRCDPSELE